MRHYFSSWQDIVSGTGKLSLAAIQAEQRDVQSQPVVIPSAIFISSLLVCRRNASESTQQDLAHPDSGSGRRDPGCYGKGHPGFTLMDSSDSVAESELSRAPWQQRATNG